MQLLHCWWSWCMMTKAQMQQTRGEGTDRGWPPGSLAHQTRRRSADTPSAVVSADNNDDRTEFVGDMYSKRPTSVAIIYINTGQRRPRRFRRWGRHRVQRNSVRGTSLARERRSLVPLKMFARLQLIGCGSSASHSLSVSSLRPVLFTHRGGGAGGGALHSPTELTSATACKPAHHDDSGKLRPQLLHGRLVSEVDGLPDRPTTRAGCCEYSSTYVNYSSIFYYSSTRYFLFPVANFRLQFFCSQ